MIARIAVILAIAAAAAPAPRQASRVTVHASVSAPGTAPPPALAPEDFEILVNGAPRAVASATAVDRPAAAMVFDVTASVYYVEDSLERALNALADRVTPADRLLVGAFGRELTLSENFVDRERMRTARRSILRRPGDDLAGPSPIWDVLALAANELGKYPGPRAIVLVSDGRATGNRLSMAQAMEQLAARHVALHVILIGPPPELARIPQDSGAVVAVNPARPLLQFTEVTGGTIRRAGAVLPITVLIDALADLRYVYALEFESAAADGRFPRLEVRTNRIGVTVRAPTVLVAR